MCLQSRVIDQISKLEKMLEQRYPRMLINSRFCFMKSTGEIFSLQKFPGADAIVVEYAANYAEAALNRFEDGDRFYLDEMDTEVLLCRILQEVNQ